MRRRAVTEHLFAYVDYLRDRGVAPRTVTEYRSKVRIFLTWLAEKPFTLAACRDYREYRQREGKRPRTVRVDFTALRSFVEFLEAEALVDSVPDITKIRLPRKDPVRSVRATAADVDRLFDAIQHMPQQNLPRRFVRYRVLGIIAVLSYTALRRSELLALDTTDLIALPDGKWAIQVRCGKGGEGRTVPFNDHGVALLQQWLEVRSAWCREHGHTTAALWPVDGGESQRRLSHRGLRRLWGDLLSAAGITADLKPHGMRHFVAKLLEKLGGLPVAQKALGHNRISTTFEYLHADDVDVDQAAQQLPQFGAAARKEVAELPATPAPPVPAAGQPQEPAAPIEHVGKRPPPSKKKLGGASKRPSR